jgi:methyl-accepting chemotaxis protein
VEEAAAAAESLEEQAQALVRAVGVFRLAGDADGGRALPSSLDFDGVTQAHMNWKHKLRSFLAGEGEPLDPDVVSRDDKCVLGCWIHGEGQRYASDLHYSRLREKHADFHLCAGEVIRAKQSGDEAGARRLLLNEFSVLSDETIQEIRSMKRSFGNESAPARAAMPAPVVLATVSPLPVRAAKSGKVGAPVPKVKHGESSLAAAEWEEF